MRKLILFAAMALATISCTQKKTDHQLSDKPAFVKQKDGHFVIGDKPYYFIGTNYWYGAILGSTG